MPVGVPKPGDVAVTMAMMVTRWPDKLELGDADTTVIVKTRPAASVTVTATTKTMIAKSRCRTVLFAMASTLQKRLRTNQPNYLSAGLNLKMLLSRRSLPTSLVGSILCRSAAASSHFGVCRSSASKF